MIEKNLDLFFEAYLRKYSLFLEKMTLQPLYIPEQVLHRADLTKEIANVLAPCLKLEKPSNLFLYGKTGTGKTLCIKFIAQKIKETSNHKNIPVKIEYLNCKIKRVADTEYRLVAQLARFFGKAIPITGLPTDEVYKIFFETIDSKKQIVILILDEIDQLVKKTGDTILYNLTRINEELNNAQIALIGISNDLTFVDHLDPRVKSSLSEEEIVFPPYNDLQIQDILKQRAEMAFKKNVLESGTIEKCAAYAAREHGDARRALDLLRVAGELAERKGLRKVGIEQIDEAEDKIEHDRILDIVTTQPKQHQAVLYGLISLSNEIIFTGELYEVYKKICYTIGLRPLTQRRVSDILAEFDMLGIINTRVISKGRYGRTKEITLSIPNSTTNKTKKILEEGLDLS